MSTLEARIRQARSQQDILLMTHIVVGYPSFAASLEIVDAMVAAGVRSDGIADPVFRAHGRRPRHPRRQPEGAGRWIDRCALLDFAATVTRKHSIPFLCMSYYNLLFRAGVASFVDRMQAAGLSGAIVPDLPPEEAGEYLPAMARAGLDPIFIFSPSTSDERLRHIAASARGFVYCVARKGVTGLHTTFSADLDAYLARCRTATKLPLALGFGVQDAADVACLRGKVDIAVVGSASLRLIDDKGVAAVGAFVRGLR